MSNEEPVTEVTRTPQEELARLKHLAWVSGRLHGGHHLFGQNPFHPNSKQPRVVQPDAAIELQHLKRLRDRKAAHWLAFFDSDFFDWQTTASQRLYWAIHPEHAGDEDQAADFWAGICVDEVDEDDEPIEDPIDDFVRGFADGMLDPWK